MSKLVTPRTATDDDILVHREVRVRGVVQGVGFRPFVYRVARAHSLRGAVWNDPQGVVIRVQGPQKDISSFVHTLHDSFPTAARVDSLDISSLELHEYLSFEIVASARTSATFTHVSSDLVMCDACRAEFNDPANRRYHYPFINCTQCGPRFSIVKELPYDRPLTTMARFEMCPECQHEYDDPTDRRFHAQPNACNKCGPTLEFYVDTQGAWRKLAREEDVITAAAQLIHRGGVLLMQGIGGFHLVCDATDELAIKELRSRKRRDAKPFAVMFPDIESLEACCVVSKQELACLTSPRAPIVILERRPDCAISDSVAPDHPSVGALLPYSPLHLAFMTAVDQPVIMTSANISGEPILFDFETARYRMYGVAEAALVHNRRIHIFADDSVVKVADDKPRVWRRSRGYAPESINLSIPFQHTTLGFGTELKNTFAIGKSSSAILSQHLGDFETTEGVEAAQQALEHYLKLFDARIEHVACDLHPDLISTRIAEEWSDARDLPLFRVQHHHAHLAACLAEHHHVGPAVGLILDGTGYGTDGCIWGGELLFGDCNSFTRLGHLQDVPLLGHDAAARQPWRMALAWLNQVYDSNLDTLDLRLLRQIDEQFGRSAKTLLLQAVRQTPFICTTSLGRLFDAVAALIGFGAREQYEGQAAMWLEGIISHNSEVGYNFEIIETDGTHVLSPEPMFRRLVTDLLSGVPARVMSHSFHEGLAQAWARMALIAAEESSCEHVALSGGCFQNKFLLERISYQLKARNINVLIPENFPMNDGGIALGQIVIANSLEL